MSNLKSFFLVLAVFSLVSLPLYSEVVLTDEEAAIVETALIDCEEASIRHQQELEGFRIELQEVQSDLSLSELALEQLLKSSEKQKREALWKGIAIGTSVTITVGGITALAVWAAKASNK